VLLIPGGASTVHGYFPQLATSLGTRARVIEADPPGIGASSDRRPLRLSGYAAGLAQAIRHTGGVPAVVVGHSLGGLIALRLAVDEPGLVAGLLLLDPTPLTPPGTLKLMAPSLKVFAALGPAGQRLWNAGARRDLRGVSMSAEQARALAVYTHPRFLAENARWARHLGRDGAALAADLAARKPTAVQAMGSHLMDIHGIGPAGAARILADAGDVARFPDRNHFRVPGAGTAPIDASSGQHLRHRLSRAGNRRLNHVLYMAAFAQPRRHPRPGLLPAQAPPPGRPDGSNARPAPAPPGRRLSAARCRRQSA
jgi:pimeloyl-ACP methyl ester carboxylesterase